MTMLMMLIGGIGAILLGLPYIFHAFGPTEAEVILWGRFSLCMGASLLLLSLGFGRSRKIAAKVFLSIGFLSLALFQGFPILLWFAFDGLGISDGTPRSTFVAHWSYSIPHVALLIVSLIILYQLWWFPLRLPSQEAKRN
jgi:hypothetical protein